ncbi:MAG TPA: hypothetical protein VIL07_03245 [Symbiobacteriaceae bacterium]
MPTDLFLQDAPLPSIPDEMVRPLRHILEAAGHSTLWNAGTRTLVIDSPLEGRVIRCQPLGHQDERTGRFIHMLQRRIDTAGGIVAEQERPLPDVTLWISVEPPEADDRTRVLLRGRPRGWFSTRAPLGEVVGEKLRTTLRVPVGITLTGGIQRRELQVYLWAPEEAFPTIATALWLGLMAYFRMGPPVRVPPAPPDFLPAPPSPSHPHSAPASGQTSPVHREQRPDPTCTKAPDSAGNSALRPEPKPESPEPESPLPPQPQATAGPSGNPPPESTPPAQEPSPAEQPRQPQISVRAGSRHTTETEWGQVGPITRRIPFHEPIPGTVIWSSGDVTPGLSSGQARTETPPSFAMPLAGGPVPQAVTPGMQASLVGDQPIFPDRPPTLSGYQPGPAGVISHMQQPDTTARNEPYPSEPHTASAPPSSGTPPPPPPNPPQPPKARESQKASAPWKPARVQTIEATVTSGNVSVMKEIEQKTERRRPHV